MSEGRRFPISSFIMLMLIAAPIALTAWWFSRPAVSSNVPELSLDDLDLVCVGRVDIQGQVVSLEPSQPGRVIEIFVSEGSTVTRGQPILRIDDSAYTSAVLEAKMAIAAAQIEVDAAEWKAKQNPNQIALQQKKVDAAMAQVTAAEVRLSQMQSQATATDKVTKADLDVMEAQLRAQKAYVEGEQLILQQMKSWDPTLETRAAKSRLSTASVSLDRMEKALAECVLKAPTNGTILRLSTGPGATLAPGSPMPTVVFAPAEKLIVRAELEQGGLGRIQEGMQAIIRDDTRADSVTWKGRVQRVADWVALRRAILFEPGEMNDIRTVEVIVEVEPSEKKLWIGQRVQVRITGKKMDTTHSKDKFD